MPCFEDMNTSYVNRGNGLDHHYDPMTSVLSEARELSFFWEDCDKYKSQKLLSQPHVAEGTFILRKSSTVNPAKGKYLTITVKRTFSDMHTTVWHFPITATKSRMYYLASSQQRSTIKELLDYHKRNPLKGANLPDVCPLSCGLPNPAQQSSAYSQNYAANDEVSEVYRETSFDNRSRSDSVSGSPVVTPRSVKLHLNTTHRPPVPSPRSLRKHSMETAPSTSSEYDDHLVKCDCGVPLQYTQLADGWSVHKSTREDNTNGLLYFLDPYGNSSWQLHPDVDRKCLNRPYLKYGTLNYTNFDLYYVPYDRRSDLMKAVSVVSLTSMDSADSQMSKSFSST